VSPQQIIPIGQHSEYKFYHSTILAYKT